MDKIEKRCAVCGKPFIPKTVESIYCSKTCSNVAYRKKKIQIKKEEERQAIVAKVTDARLYISVPEAIAMFGVAKSTLYRIIRQKKLPAINP